MTYEQLTRAYDMRQIIENIDHHEHSGSLGLHPLFQILAWCGGKAIAREFECHRRSYPDDARCAVAIFADGTGLMVDTDDGWDGTDVTGGRERSVTYYALTPKVLG